MRLKESFQLVNEFSGCILGRKQSAIFVYCKYFTCMATCHSFDRSIL